MRLGFFTSYKFGLRVLLAFVSFSSVSYAQDESFARKRCVEVGFPAGTVGHADCVKQYLKSAGKGKSAAPKREAKPSETVIPEPAIGQSNFPACKGNDISMWSNCTGTKTFSNGTMYVGEFKDGKLHGRGTGTFANGNKYVGDFKNGALNGQGTFTYANGDKYVGEFKDDKKNGQGTATFADGYNYVGEWKDDKRNGQGTATFADGNKYVGEYKDDKRNGQGTFTFADGSMEVGEYKDGKLNGRAIKYSADGIVTESGIYKDDVFVTSQEPVQSAALGAVFKDCDDCPEMVVVPAGQFVMGASPGEEERENLPKDFRDLSQPQYSVMVRQFAAGRFSVTRGQYELFVNATGRNSDGCYVWTGSDWEKDLAKDWRSPGYAQDKHHPVACINWDDASAYVQWLSQKTGKSYRLLSEAEWEYAARAGTTTYRYWGDSGNLSCTYANGADQTAKAQVSGASNWAVATCNDGYAYTAPVGSFQPNRFGLYDMLGNVWQWTQDCWNGNYSGAPNDGSGWTRGNCSRRVIRGGSWYNNPEWLRVAYRSWAVVAARYDSFGFRVAVDIPPVSLGAVIVTPDSVSKAVGVSKPSDSYLGRLRARVKPNITFSDSQLQSVRGNPAAEVEVICSSSGQIMGMKLTQSSGNTAWDQAVLKAIEKTGTLPRDENGNIPSKIRFVFRPRD